MEIEINWLAILLATIASMALAGMWYGNTTFGPAWRRLTGITPKDSKKAGLTPMIITLFANFITAWALAAMINVGFVFFATDSLWTALLVGFVSWLAFSATTLATHNAFELKQPKLTLINNSYQLSLFLIMALVIGLFGA